ncbi:MAG: hypothetical protein FJX54_04045 [Alphaproteobacteria bacterium]|nr:hypothetical protein [Alphaproteobacteria bacterium]
MSKLVLAGALLATTLLGGCVVYPYGDPYYGAPGAYGSPGYVGGTIYYEDRGHRRHRHRHRHYRGW